MFATAARAADPPTVVQVVTLYRRESARVLDETVTAPLLTQIAGVEGMKAVVAQSHAGSSIVAVHFSPGIDPARARQLVLDRVALARPQLPADVRIFPTMVGQVTFRTHWLAVHSDRLDLAGLSDLVWELERNNVFRWDIIPGVSTLGGVGSRFTVTIDPDRLAAYGLTATDVTLAIGTVRPADPAEFGNVVVKEVGPKIARIKDVAEVTRGVWAPWAARLDERPAVLLTANVPAGPLGRRAWDAAVVKARGLLPAGATLTDFADRTTAAPGTLFLVELTPPAGTGLDRQVEAAERASKSLRAAFENASCVAVAHPSSRDPVQLLVRLPKAPDGGSDALRRLLARERECVPRVAPVTPAADFPPDGFAVRLALAGPNEARCGAWAAAVVERLAKEKAAADPAASGPAPVPTLTFELDREKAKALSVPATEVARLFREATTADVPMRDSLTVSLRIRGQRESPGADALKQMTVPGAGGKAVPLSAVATLKETLEPAAVRRVGLDPAVLITAAPPDGVSPAASAAKCKAVAEAVRADLKLGAAYKVVDLTAAGK